MSIINDKKMNKLLTRYLHKQNSTQLRSHMYQFSMST